MLKCNSTQLILPVVLNGCRHIYDSPGSHHHPGGICVIFSFFLFLSSLLISLSLQGFSWIKYFVFPFYSCLSFSPCLSEPVTYLKQGWTRLKKETQIQKKWGNKRSEERTKIEGEKGAERRGREGKERGSYWWVTEEKGEGLDTKTEKKRNR